jgi:hypothetical protein
MTGGWVKPALSAIFIWLLSAQPAVCGLVLGNQGMPVTNPSSYLSVMTDPSGALEIDDILAGSAPAFTPDKRTTPSFGFTNDALWLKFDIHSEADQDQPLVIKLGSARISHLTWHVVVDGRLERTVPCGAFDPERPSYRLPRLEFELPAGRTATIYARARSDTALWMPLRVGSPAAMYGYLFKDTAWNLMLIGFCLGCAFFGLVSGIIHRQSLYYHLCLFALIFVMYYAAFNGYLRMMWPGLPRWFERDGFGAGCMAGIYVFTRFSATFLNLGTIARRVRLFHRAAAVPCLAGFLLFLILEFRHSIQLLMPLQMLTIILGSIAVAIQLGIRRGKQEIILLATWLCYGVLILLLSMQLSSVTPVALSFNVLQQLFIPVILAGFLLAMMDRQSNLAQLKLHVAKSRQSEAVAQLDALRYQLNPHFLFNTLTSIEALSHFDPARIPQLVSRLATFLRLRLAPSKDGMARFEQELETIRSYLEIEHMRFGDVLKTEYHIDARSLQCAVPELLLQPLVENAVKHGFECDCGIEIEISSMVTDDRLGIVIANRKSPTPTADARPGLGLGLANIRQRLELLYGQRASFSIEDEGCIIVARLDIPMEPLES